MILSVQNIDKAFLEETILKDVCFYVEDHEKVAVVGINGAGKTTLLRILMGELPADNGMVTLAKNKVIGYLPQNASVDSENTIYEELLSVKRDLVELEARIRETECQMEQISAENGGSGSREGKLSEIMERYTLLTHQFEAGGGYLYRSELVGVLKGLGFSEDEFSHSISTLSGGQKTRVALGKLLLQKPDLIILDEPTNHLDLNSITWLETYLLNYKGAVILVSHDRFFLDRIATKVIELDLGRATTFLGNYTSYAEKKEQLRTAALRAYLNQQREIHHQQQVIEKLRSFNREKSIKRAESREKMLEKIDVLEKPVEASTDMKLELVPHRLSGNDVLTVENLAKSFGRHDLFTNLSFDLKRGEHIAIIGDNGTGKTTILKIINGLLPADDGKITLGSNVEIGYYDQEHHVLHDDKTLFEEISDEYPMLSNTEIRNTLAAFLFTGDDVFKRIGDLSGGEKGRVSLAKLMLSNSNFLILDEPTNHLDIQSKEILEDALNRYTGTVLYVSHDRYFINRTAGRILELENHALTNYLGNYDYYLEKKQDTAAGNPIDATSFSPLRSASADTPDSSDSAGTSTKQDWQTHKEQQAKERKRKNDLQKCEAEIERLENRKSVLEEEMSLPEVATNSVKLQELTKEILEIEASLTKLYEDWESLAE